LKVESKKLKVGVYPNPFVSNAFISFSTDKEYLITLEVFSLTGESIRTIASNQFPTGDYRLVWDGRDDGGSIVKPGTYLVCLYLDGKLVSAARLTKSSR
jgi:flagellar hook assembly protein FlgD